MLILGSVRILTKINIVKCIVCFGISRRPLKTEEKAQHEQVDK